jgi:hypothetical protein
MKSKSIFILVSLLALVSLACSVDFGGSTPTPVSNAATIPAVSEQPTSTAVPIQPTPTTVTASASTGKILFQDDFSNANSGWETGDYSGDTLSYLNGTYDIFAKTEGSILWGVASQNFTDLIIDVDAAQLSGPADNNTAYGVYCRRTGENNSDAYAFFVSGDGYYSIIKITSGSFASLVDWTSSDVINQGDASNHLTASCIGDHLTLSVNGTEVADTYDSSYTSGDISLAAGSMETTGIEAQFDNLVVTEP